jgi:hypothetical protein
MRRRARFNATPAARKRDAGSIAVRYLPAILLLLLLGLNVLVLGIAG